MNVKYHEDNGERLEHLKEKYFESLSNYLEEDSYEDIEVKQGILFETAPPVRPGC